MIEPLSTSMHLVNPYRGYLVDKTIAEAKTADAYSKRKWAHAEVAAINYFNAVSVRKHILAPYIRANFRYLEQAAYIPIPGIDQPVLFQAGSVVDANPDDMRKRAKYASSRVKSDGSRPLPVHEYTKDSPGEVSDVYYHTLYEDFCVLPSLDRPAQRKSNSLPGLINVTLGNERQGTRKRYKFNFGWMVMILRHPDIPASAPLDYVLIDKSVGSFQDSPTASVVWERDYSLEKPVLSPNKWAAGNLVLRRLEPIASFERRAGDFDVYRHNDVIASRGEFWEHPFSEKDQHKLQEMLHCDILAYTDHYAVSSRDVSNIRLPGYPVPHEHVVKWSPQ